MSTDRPKPPPSRRRSPRHVRGAARLIVKEAGRIVRRHEQRLGAGAAPIKESIERIRRLDGSEEVEALEQEAEKLDQLLQQHAGFARKSALRETVENIAVAILVALALRSCLYEPFKIPSGSMMPTLRAGDHIFVNKFVYGIQVPFTNTVIGERWGEIRRGEVAVFRYPLDESEDFIKRVIGLPGDTVRVEGRQVAIKRVGEETFEELQRTPLDEACYDEGQTRIVPDCQLYEEKLDDATYVVRYRPDYEDRVGGQPSRTWVVPEHHLLVMGDNRNESHDSLAWTVTVEAVSAQGLLSAKDLRDLTRDAQFTQRSPGDDGVVQTDPNHDRITYLADQRSSKHDLELSIWRDPVFGLDATLQTVLDDMPGAAAVSVAELLARLPDVEPAERDRWLDTGKAVQSMAIAASGRHREVVASLAGQNAVIHLECGVEVCSSESVLLERLFSVLANFAVDREQDARELLSLDFGQQPSVRFAPHWTRRDNPDHHFLHRRFVTRGRKDAAAELELWAWRHPEEGTVHLRNAALTFLESSPTEAQPVSELGDRAWLVTGTKSAGLVLAADDGQGIAVLRCRTSACMTPGSLQNLGALLKTRLPEAVRDRRAFHRILAEDDLAGFVELPVATQPQYGFDRLTLEGSVRGASHRIDLDVWLTPDGDTKARLDALAQEHAMEPDQSIPGGLQAVRQDGTWLAAPLPETNAVVLLHCSSGLCGDPKAAHALFERVLEKGRDPGQFIDPAAERAKPFVPRGNVKGRAERIWLPLSRFWLPIR